MIFFIDWGWKNPDADNFTYLYIWQAVKNHKEVVWEGHNNDTYFDDTEDDNDGGQDGMMDIMEKTLETDILKMSRSKKRQLEAEIVEELTSINIVREGKKKKMWSKRFSTKIIYTVDRNWRLSHCTNT